MQAQDLVIARPEGLYCPPGDFYIDPWRPVERAVITHAHADHARRGNTAYLAAAPAEGVLRARLGDDIRLQALPYGETIDHFGVRVSLHPAGHVLGLGAGSPRTRRPGLGRVGRLLRRRLHRRPARGQRDLRAVRAGALRLLHHRVDVRAADLPLASAARALRRRRCLVARQCRSRPRQPADGLQLRQGAAHPGRRRLVDRADRRARRGRAAEPGLPRRRRRAAADPAGHRRRRQGDA